MGEDRAYWNRRAFEFSAPHSRLQAVARMVDDLQCHAETLLDIGCAGAALRRLLPSTIEYFGIDIADAVIACQHDPSHFEVVDLEMASACFCRRTFDIVVCSGVVEYIKHLDRLFVLIRNVMRPDGHLVLTFTNHEHYLDLILHKSYKDPHVNFMAIADLIRYLRAQGFRIVRDTSLTTSARELPVLAHFRRSPFNLWNRQYLFLCRRQLA